MSFEGNKGEGEKKASFAIPFSSSLFSQHKILQIIWTSTPPTQYSLLEWWVCEFRLVVMLPRTKEKVLLQVTIPDRSKNESSRLLVARLCRLQM